MLDLTAFLSEPASVAEIISGTTTVTLGGESFVIRARSIEGDEEWVAGLDGQLRGLLDAIDKAGNDTTAILAALGAFPGELLAALCSYDEYGVLPPAGELRRKARSHELLVALAKVWRLANPLAAIALAGIAVAKATNGTGSVPTTPLRGHSRGRLPKSAES